MPRKSKYDQGYDEGWDDGYKQGKVAGKSQNYEFPAGPAFVIGFIIAGVLVIVLFMASTVDNSYIDNTGEYFCNDYGLTYDDFIIEPNEHGKKMIWFECVNETRVDTIGIMKYGGDA